MNRDFRNNQNLIEGIIFDDGFIMQIIAQEENMMNNIYGRMNTLNNPRSTEAIDKIKFLNTMSDGYMTIPMVADYFEVGYKTIHKNIERNFDELINNGLVILEGQPLRDYKNSGILQGDIMSNRRINKLILLNRRVVLNIAMLLRDSVIAKGIRYAILNVLDTDEGRILLQREAERLRKENEILRQQLQVETKRANHYQNAYNGIYYMYMDMKNYIETEYSYKDRYEDLLNNRGYYDHQAYANTFPYSFY